MTEQELKDAITSACEADYKHAMAAPKHRFSRTFRKKIKVLLQPDMGKHTIPALYPVHGRRRVIVVVAVLVLLLGTTVTGRSFFPESARKIYSDRVYRPCATESGRTGESGNGGNRGQREEHNGDWC